MRNRADQTICAARYSLSIKLFSPTHTHPRYSCETTNLTRQAIAGRLRASNCYWEVLKHFHSSFNYYYHENPGILTAVSHNSFPFFTAVYNTDCTKNLKTVFFLTFLLSVSVTRFSSIHLLLYVHENGLSIYTPRIYFLFLDRFNYT